MAWNREQSAATGIAASATTISLAFGSVVKAGSLIVSSISYGAGSGGATFSDNINGAWSAAVTTTNDAPFAQTLSTSYFANSGTGAFTVNGTFPSGNLRRIIITEYSGILTAGPIDGTPAQHLDTTATGHTSPTVTVSQAGDLVYGAVSADINAAITITSSDLSIIKTVGGSNPAIGAGDKTGPSSGTTSAGFIFNNTSPAAIHCLCFKISASSGAYQFFNFFRP